KKT
ncbi:hypothetical protein TYRP_016320, partial [Tyrophagus putrescentiae]